MLNKHNITDWVNDYTQELFNKVSDTELAKDLVQDVFLAATENSDKFRKNKCAQ